MKTVLYVADALRADHMSLYGYGRKTTPNLNARTSDFIKFSNCHSQSTWTRASAATILSGVYPLSSGVVGLQDSLSQDIPTIATILQDADVTTMGISAMGNVSTEFGFSNGFDKFLDLYKHAIRSDNRAEVGEKLFVDSDSESEVFNPDGGDINSFSLDWIEEHASEDFFLLIWSIDTHDPYNPRSEFQKYSQGSDRDVAKYSDLHDCSSRQEARWIENLYDDSIRQVDYYIEEIMDKLEQEGIYEETFVGITGDHGEGFGEHGVYGHADIPYEELINVPLAIKPPENANCPTPGQTSDELVEHTDLLPSVLDLYDVQQPEHIQGEPLFTDQGISGTRHQSFSYTKLQSETPEFYSVIRGNKKYILVEPTKLLSRLSDPWLESAKRRVYHRMRYPVQQEKLLTIPGDEELNAGQTDIENFRASLDDWIRECRGEQRNSAQDRELSDDTEKQLREMGYIE